jgi:class 3 adenylate cyclase
MLQPHFVVFFDRRPYTKSEAFNSLSTTAFICLVLCVGSLVFSKDANALVLHPVEEMIAKVNAIRDNPLIAMKMADAEFHNQERARIKKLRAEKQMSRNVLLRWFHKVSILFFPESDQKGEMMETKILETTIVKLGSLLALGFGEAGADIVSVNMRSSAGVNAMIPGNRVECFIGSARVKDFGIFTEVLQGRVMAFVNQISEIVHGIADQYHGAANKNSGDAFLLIWRADKGDEARLTRLSDMSVCSLVSMLGALHESRILAKYRSHPGLQQRLGSDCRVNMSFGLHFGWAIEGAVGSEFKIDASYLSPTVSIAESMERLTEIYNVGIVVSKDVISRCSKEILSVVRLIDRVSIRNSKEPLELFSVDLDYGPLVVRTQTFFSMSSGHKWNVGQRFKARQLLEIEKQRRLAESGEVAAMFHEQLSAVAMRKLYTAEFLQIFNMGYQNYSQGEWQVAARLLGITQQKLGWDDGPSCALLAFMDTYSGVAPKNWQGVRSVDEDEAARRM